MSFDQPEPVVASGDGYAFAIVAARYNQSLVDALVDAARRTLLEAGVRDGDLEVLRVPGAAEIPYAAAMLADTGNFDCIVCLGVILAGETRHDQILADSTAAALQSHAFETGVPMINGIIAAETRRQAEERCLGALARGAEFGRAALEMAAIKVDLENRIAESREQEEAREDEEDGWEDYEEDDADEESDESPWKS